MSFDWSTYTGNLTWLPERTLYLTRHGSHAYGTNIETSDLDLRGICIAPPSYYHGFVEWARPKGFEQAMQKEPDFLIFEIRKFFMLAADCNANALELLFTDPSDHLLVTPLMERLLAARDEFLSLKVKSTFSGYALGQLKRINLHYRWLKNPPPGAPTRAEFNLPERTVIPADQLAAANAAIQKQLDVWNWHDLDELAPSTRQAVKDEFFRRLVEITQWSWDEVDDQVWRAAALTLGLTTNFIELLDMERRYTARMREWQQYQKWLKERNPARAKLEEKFGYDTKHALHLVRLLLMCREILTDGKVLVRRPDREFLLSIRYGLWDYFELVAWAEKQNRELTEIAKVSKLPSDPNWKLLDPLCVGMVEESFRTAA